MAQGIKWPFITSNNHGKNAANLFLAKTASASKIANMTVLVGSFGWFCNMVKDVSIRGRVCEDMMAKNRLCIPGPFGGWSHVPWGACGDYTVCLHEAQPEIKLLAFPVMATAPWRHEGLPVWQISQCLVRIRRCRVSFGSLPCRCFNAVPFPSHPCLGSWAGEMVPCPASGVAKSSGPRRHVILYQRRHGADSRPGKLE